MQGLKSVLSTLVQDAPQELIEAEVTVRLGATAGNGPQSSAGLDTDRSSGRHRPRKGTLG